MKSMGVQRESNMKDNLPNIWHNHDGKGMPVYLQNDQFEVQLRDGTKLKNHRRNWDWGHVGSAMCRPPFSGDVVGWRYILPDSWNKTGPLTAEDFDGVVEIDMDVPKNEIQKYPEDNRLTKYQRLIRGKDQNGNIASIAVDVYDVLTAWEVQNPALQHLIKKALQPGERGHKSLVDDLKDIIASAQRALELAKGDMK